MVHRLSFAIGRAFGLAGVLLCAIHTNAGGQVLQAPRFAFEPGVITVNALSAPGSAGSSTGLNLRFVAVVPTRVPWLTVALGTSFAPLGLSNGLRAFNEPTFFYGPVTLLLPRDRTANWLELTLPLLGAYRLDETGEEDRLYVNDLIVQGVATVPVGEKLMADMGSFWSRVAFYAIVEQNLTPSRNVTTQRVDRFNPTFQYGVSIPIGRRAAGAAGEP
ncbi:MAG TPA: hypothetical protein VFZ21_25390 [Gemmatimonadaceae bacterium]|jgi:hypothetical protein|nr:hypothetical protein [Gemmatimonadaceae bacterium]